MLSPGSSMMYIHILGGTHAYASLSLTWHSGYGVFPKINFRPHTPSCPHASQAQANLRLLLAPIHSTSEGTASRSLCPPGLAPPPSHCHSLLPSPSSTLPVSCGLQAWSLCLPCGVSLHQEASSLPVPPALCMALSPGCEGLCELMTTPWLFLHL